MHFTSRPMSGGLESRRTEYTWYLRQGWLSHLAEDHEPAAAAYEKAVAAAPRAVEPRMGLQLPQLALRRWQDAEATARAYLAALAMYPSDIDMRAGLGWSLLMEGRNAEAAHAFKAVLRVAPNHTSARAGLEAAVAAR